MNPSLRASPPECTANTRRSIAGPTGREYERGLRSRGDITVWFSGEARDILGITVKRWLHAYKYTYNTLFDEPEWALGTPSERHAIVGRKRFGRIDIADAAASFHTDSAINEAYRAVHELRDHVE